MKKGFSRRDFLKTVSISTAGLMLFPGCNKNKYGDKIRLGFIGLGQQGNHLFLQFIKNKDVIVLAGADVYEIKRQRFSRIANRYYDQQGVQIKVETYENYEKLLTRKDIDAIVIATPDHWHAKIALEACEAGMDIYLEKPLTFTIDEGKKLVKAVRNHKRVLAVGSMQRSDGNFQYAVNNVINGRIGKLKEVFVCLNAKNDGYVLHPKQYDLPEEPLPQGLNWDMWLGPNAPQHYNSKLNPTISFNPYESEKFWGCWRWYKEFGGGLMTDWGAHMVDIAQWGMGIDRSGPVKVIPDSVDGNEFLTYEYASGIPIYFRPYRGFDLGVKFWGENGWIEVSRGKFASSDESLKYGKEKYEEHRSTHPSHYQDFINSVKSRKDPIVPVEVGHRICTACTMGNIANELKRPLHWNPEKEIFLNDEAANTMLKKEYRKEYM